MITLKKLGELPRKTRLRKIARILLRMEYSLRGLPSPDDYASEVPDERYLQALFRMVAGETRLTASLRDRAARYAAELEADGALREAARRISDIRYGIEEYLGHTPADWDFPFPGPGPGPESAAAKGAAPGAATGATVAAGSGAALESTTRRSTEPLFLYLDDVRSPFNVGAIFRAADSFAVRGIFLSEGCASPEHPRAARASMGTVNVIPWQRASVPEAAAAASAGGGASLFAVETGGTPLAQFRFPCGGLAIVGAEELGVSGEALALAEQSAGRVTVPTAGIKGSLNVAVATGIVLYQWWQQVVQQTAGPSTR